MIWKRRRRTATALPVAEAYRRWARTYGAEPNELQRLEHAAMLELLPELGGRKVLDLGCGPGRLARLAAQREAARVVGLDACPAMLERAAGDDGRTAWAAAAAEHLPLPPDCFDVVLAGLVLGHVDDLAGALTGIGRILRPGGVLLLSDFHPFATLHGWQRTFDDPESGGTRVIEHHLHLLEDYVRALRGAGLFLEGLREPLWQRVPVVLALRAGKPE